MRRRRWLMRFGAAIVDNAEAYTSEQREAFALLVAKVRQFAAAAVQGFVAAAPIFLAAAEAMKSAETNKDAPREAIDLAGLKAALGEGSAELPPATFDREGKWRYNPSAN